MDIPDRPKIYHIMHVDRLRSIVERGYLLCDAKVVQDSLPGTTIGMAKRRLNELALSSYPDVRVGDCVPFYFCPRSVMLYILWRANHPDLLYRGGQAPIIHLEADLYATVEAANREEKRWAFTTSNAGSRYFEDYSSLNDLDKVNWNAIRATDWKDYQEEKQAEFLVEGDFPWFLVERIGVCSEAIFKQVDEILKGCGHKPHVEIRPDWYY